MALFPHQAAILFLLMFTWFLNTKARLISDNSNNLIADVFSPRSIISKNRFFPSDEFAPVLEFDGNFRSRKMLKPRATRVGENLDLFTARGYGKRSGNNCSWGICKKKMTLFTARRFGKKRTPEEMSKLMCALTDCKNSASLEEDFSNLVERRDKEIPEENFLNDV